MISATLLVAAFAVVSSRPVRFDPVFGVPVDDDVHRDALPPLSWGGKQHHYHEGPLDVVQQEDEFGLNKQEREDRLPEERKPISAEDVFGVVVRHHTYIGWGSYDDLPLRGPYSRSTTMATMPALDSHHQSVEAIVVWTAVALTIAVIVVAPIAFAGWKYGPLFCGHWYLPSPDGGDGVGPMMDDSMDEWSLGRGREMIVIQPPSHFDPDDDDGDGDGDEGDGGGSGGGGDGGGDDGIGEEAGEEALAELL